LSFQKGIDEYRAGRHYEAHEFWEELWQTEDDEDRRRFLQALIQVASAVHKAIHDVAPRGSLRLLDRAEEKLAGLGDDYLGVDLASLRQGMSQCRTEVERQLERDGHCRIDEAFVPPMLQLSDAPLLRKKPGRDTVPAAARRAWFDQGLATYQAGDYFEAHEVWEELWRDAPHGFDRTFVQGLIQVAAAMHKLFAHEKPDPAARLLRRALDKLEGAPEHYRGLDVPRLLAEGRAAMDLIEKDGTLEADRVPTMARVK
jgi:predicted metal-dependent hydrolase